MRTRGFSTDAVRLLLRTKELLLLAKGLVLGEWRESRDPVSGAFAEHCQAELKNEELRESLEIHPGAHPAHAGRAEEEVHAGGAVPDIVVFVRTYGLTLREAAAIFMVDAQTIARWTDEATREPDRKTVGSLLKATPPIRAFSDVTREMIAMLDRMKEGARRLRRCSSVPGAGSVARRCVATGRTGRRSPSRLRQS